MTKDSETSAEDLFPTRKSIKAFREASADCKACDLWKRGTQTVFGEGGRRAEIVFIGEPPGTKKISAATAAQALLGSKFKVSKTARTIH